MMMMMMMMMMIYLTIEGKKLSHKIMQYNTLRKDLSQGPSRFG